LSERLGIELGYKDEVMEKIMHGNAERVLGL
jgi:predicted TIM-barrel fold metal-dependent hydrolase